MYVKKNHVVNRYPPRIKSAVRFWIHDRCRMEIRQQRNRSFSNFSRLYGPFEHSPRAEAWTISHFWKLLNISAHSENISSPFGMSATKWCITMFMMHSIESGWIHCIPSGSGMSGACWYDFKTFSLVFMEMRNMIAGLLQVSRKRELKDQKLNRDQELKD